MIVELILNVVDVVLRTVLSIINLPNFPSSLTSSINTYINMIFENINLFGLFGFFVRPETLKIAATTFITVFMFEKSYKFIRWILKKIPFVSN